MVLPDGARERPKYAIDHLLYIQSHLAVPSFYTRLLMPQSSSWRC